MLQVNPNEVIRLNNLINNSLETIQNHLQYFRNKYNNTDKVNKLELDELDTLTSKISNSTLFLTNIINELVEATGESIDKILDSKHSLNYFENKLITYYAKNINENANKTKLDSIDLCYSKDDKLNNYCQKQNFVEYAYNCFNKFNPEEYGLDQETIVNDLLYVYDKRGSTEAYAIIRALENNAPQNYHEYNFNPTSQMHSNDYYDYNDNTINKYQTNSENIDINGYTYEIAQVLPKDCTKTEELAYNFGKTNIINTMRTLPDKYLKICSQGNSNAITLTYTRDAMNNTANWSGYYKPSAFLSSKTNSITIDIHGSFIDNTFYTQDTLIHEMGHKFDDLLYGKNVIDWIFGTTSYTKSHSEWTKAYKKYSNVVSGLNMSGYMTYPNVNEFFGDATVAYFKTPDLVKTMCPEVYTLMNNMLDGEYGYSYDEKIVHILNAN